MYYVSKKLEELDVNAPKFRERAVAMIAEMTTLWNMKLLCCMPQHKDKEPERIDAILNDTNLEHSEVKKLVQSDIFQKMIKGLHNNDLKNLANPNEMKDFHKDYIKESIKAKKAEKALENENKVEVKLDELESKEKAPEKKEEPKKESKSWGWWPFGK